MAEPTSPSAEPVAVSTHLRPVDREATGAGVPPGVYRVVGTVADHVTLLRVADADGRRAHTGEVHSVPRTALDSFELADDPDENRPLSAVLLSQLDAVVWQFRTLGRTVRDRPVPGSAALAFVILGLFGGSFLPIPDYADTILILVGVLWLLLLTNRTDSR